MALSPGEDGERRRYTRKCAAAINTHFWSQGWRPQYICFSVELYFVGGIAELSTVLSDLTWWQRWQLPGQKIIAFQRQLVYAEYNLKSILNVLCIVFLCTVCTIHTSVCSRNIEWTCCLKMYLVNYKTFVVHFSCPFVFFPLSLTGKATESCCGSAWDIKEVWESQSREYKPIPLRVSGPW